MANMEQLPDDHYRVTYDDVHLHIAQTAKSIVSTFSPEVIIGISGGGLYPARVLRTFLKRKVGNGKLVNVPIQAIGLSLYEDLGQDEKEGLGPSAKAKIGTTVVRTQWLDAAKPKVYGSAVQHSGLLGKNILIVDEVDDSRTTLRYAYHELLSDVESSLAALTPEERAEIPPTRFAIFVVHNKLREKKGSLPIIWSNHQQTQAGPSEDQAHGKEERLAGGQEIVASRQDENGTVVPGVWYFAAETTEDCWIEYPWEQDDILEHNRITALAKKLGQNKGRVE
ncbi:hypothetical protein CBS101457_006819 [Exobasidium rhododendri]|nr:hypothetical protein CBS101457_006819 [Exobasidium rhododendri]